MKLTFPHMGNLSLVLTSLFNSLGLEVVVAPRISKNTFNLGSKHSPEFACLPLKLNLGNYIEAMEQGADTIVMLGGHGPCRFGYYAQIQRRILTQLGYDFDMIILESPEDNANELTSQLKKLGNTNSWKTVLLELYLAFNKLKAIDQIDKKISEVRPITNKNEQLESLYYDFKQHMLQVSTNKQLRDTTTEIWHALDKLKNIEPDPIKIAIVGDIYIMLEPNANMQLEKKLGELGARVERTIYLSDWILDRVILEKMGINRNRKINEEAKPFLNHFVGGHGRESVGQAVTKSKEGYDGLVHIMPFTCTPEIVAQNILSHVSKKYNLPMLTVIIDEHTGEAGLDTRLEAFYDLLTQKREVVNLQ